ncbi:hypothetical protein GCM10027395_20900 [Giesbergeria sinuosa]
MCHAATRQAKQDPHIGAIGSRDGGVGRQMQGGKRVHCVPKQEKTTSPEARVSRNKKALYHKTTEPSLITNKRLREESI